MKFIGIFVVVFFKSVISDGLNGTVLPSAIQRKADSESPSACVSNYLEVHSRKDPGFRFFHETEEQNDLKWRIVGGHQMDIQRAPYAVLYGPYCGGVLIAPQWVITAAHCQTTARYVTAGATDGRKGTRYQICAHYLHPHWDAPHKLHGYDFDYQLILLEKPVPVTSATRPIAIGNEDDIEDGEMVAVSGWGYKHAEDEQMQAVLRQVSVPVIPRAACQGLPQRIYKTITPRLFCAGYLQTGKKDACKGDSGGPAVRSNKLVGLVSFGIGCAEANSPGAYTNVPLARSWIREITGLPL